MSIEFNFLEEFIKVDGYINAEFILKIELIKRGFLGFDEYKIYWIKNDLSI